MEFRHREKLLILVPKIYPILVRFDILLTFGRIYTPQQLSLNYACYILGNFGEFLPFSWPQTHFQPLIHFYLEEYE